MTRTLGQTVVVENVGAAGGRGDGAATVLGHLCPCGSRNKHGCGGNVKSVRPIAAGAADVHQMGGIHLHMGGKLAHDRCRCRDLGCGLHLYPQRRKKCGNLNSGDVARHNRPHDLNHLVMGQVLVGNNAI